jgi:hypothetical protein
MKPGKTVVFAVLSCALGACGASEPVSPSEAAVGTSRVQSSARALAASGSTRWARHVWGGGTDIAQSVRVSANDRISLLVNFNGPGIDVGAGDRGDGTNWPKAVVGFYNADGSYSGWLPMGAIPDYPTVVDPALTLTSMAVGPQGQTYLSGWLVGQTNFGGPFKSGSFLYRMGQPVIRVPEPFSAMAFDSAGQLFATGHGTVRKYSATGELLWERTYTARTGEPWVVHDAKVDADGNLLLGGYVERAQHSPLVAQVSPEGEVLWSSDKVTQSGEVQSLAVGPEGQVAVSLMLENLGAFVSVMSHEGELRWWARLPDASGTSVAFDTASQLAIAFSEEGAQGTEGVISLYSREGTALWTRRLSSQDGASASIQPTGVDFLSDGAVVAVGTFSGQVDFGGGPVTSVGVDSFMLALEP